MQPIQSQRRRKPQTFSESNTCRIRTNREKFRNNNNVIPGMYIIDTSNAVAAYWLVFVDDDDNVGQ